MYSILYSPGARKDLKKLPEDIAKKIVLAIKELQEDPRGYLKKLKSPPGCPLYSLRIGEYRVIMGLDADKLIIFVIEVGHRSKIYRKY
ncbi:MAG: type II toxin-antitoxin system RelE/ParE family toxin [Methanolobus sp.]|nr:type II toxin-antitoxin system RelE/ParE family toxin [Methanolobus sp.]